MSTKTPYTEWVEAPKWARDYFRKLCVAFGVEREDIELRAVTRSCDEDFAGRTHTYWRGRAFIVEVPTDFDPTPTNHETLLHEVIHIATDDLTRELARHVEEL